MKIPVRNLYFLLVYAWDLLEEASTIDVGATEADTPQDLFGHLLRSGLDRLLRRGLDRGYVEHTDYIAGVRGKIDLAATLKSSPRRTGRLVCRFDELSHDIVHNRILKATLSQLLLTEGLDDGLRRDLAGLRLRLREVGNLHLSAEAFRRVQLHSNNRSYRLLLAVCRLLYEHLLPEREGKVFRFRDFSWDRLQDLFEAFLRNFYKREQSTYPVVKRERLAWQKTYGSSEALALLPEMETDASLLSPTARLVVEAKFSSSPIVEREDYHTRSIRSTHLFQLFAYLRNLATKDDRSTAGLLLYPRVTEEFCLDYLLQGHRLRVATVDLLATPVAIHHRLLELLPHCGELTAYQP